MARAPLSPHTRALLVIGLGVVLVFTAVFAPMGVLVPTYHYEVAEVTPDSDSVHYFVGNSDQVLTCVDDDPKCQDVSRVREDGPEVVERDAATTGEMPGFGGYYRVVSFPKDDQFYRPHHEPLDNGSVLLGLEPISNRTAMDIAALDVGRFPSEFQRLFESGTVRTSDAVAGWMYWQETDELVEHEDTFYRPIGMGYSGPNSDWDEYLRILAALAGIGLLLYGRTMHLRAHDRLRPNPSAAETGPDRSNCPACGARNAATDEECSYCGEAL